jgi:hypothetical protein
MHHVVVAGLHGTFECLRCSFVTDNLTAVARHVVEHQWNVR